MFRHSTNFLCSCYCTCAHTLISTLPRIRCKFKVNTRRWLEPLLSFHRIRLLTKPQAHLAIKPQLIDFLHLFQLDRWHFDEQHATLKVLLGDFNWTWSDREPCLLNISRIITQPNYPITQSFCIGTKLAHLCLKEAGSKNRGILGGLFHIIKMMIYTENVPLLLDWWHGFHCVWQRESSCLCHCIFFSTDLTSVIYSKVY